MRKHCVVLLASCLFVAACSDADKEPPLLSFEPETITFTPITVADDEEVLTVKIVNSGSSDSEDLVLSSAEVLGASSNTLDYCGRSSCKLVEVLNFKPGTSIAPGDAITLQIKYHGSNFRNEQNGAISFQSNASNQVDYGLSKGPESRLQYKVPERPKE